MTTRTHAVPRRRPAARRRAQTRRRAVLLAMVAIIGLGAVVAWPMLRNAAKEITLPLRHEDVIRQQAAAKGLDPALVAGVIYAESKFEDRTSPAGALGLMQVTPDTARFIAGKSGGTQFQIGDLSTPQVNIAYGAWYLRYLLDRYGGNVPLALAAYNGGEGNVDRWISDARSQGRALTIDAIPFGETRAYVGRVLDAQGKYRANYAHELGL